MKQFIIPFTIIATLVLLPTCSFAQSLQSSEDLVVIPGVGVGNIKLGMTKSELATIVPNSVDDSWYARLTFNDLGIQAEYDKTTDRVNKIIVDYEGYEKRKKFNGKLEDDLKTLPQLQKKYGEPIYASSYDGIDYARFDGIVFLLGNGKLKEARIIAKKKLNPISENKITINEFKYILSEGFKGFIFSLTQNELCTQLNLKDCSDENLSHKYGISAFADKSTGKIIKIEFDERGKWKPNDNLKFGEKLKKVQEKYAGGSHASFTLSEYLRFNGFEMQFYNGKLFKIIFERNKTEEEAFFEKIIAEEKNRTESIERAKELAIENKKSSQQKIDEAKEKAQRETAQMEADYKTLLDELDSKLRIGEQVLQSEKKAIAAGGSFAKAVKDKIDKVAAGGDAIIDSFIKKYQGKVPAWMLKGIKDKWRPTAVN